MHYNLLTSICLIGLMPSCSKEKGVDPSRSPDSSYNPQLHASQFRSGGLRRCSRDCGLVFAIILGLHLCVTAQSPYRMSWDKELAFASVGAAALGTGVYLRHQITLFTPEELEGFDRFYINDLDRSATRMFSHQADRTSDVFMSTAQLMPVIFLAGKKTRRHFGQIAVMYGETMLINDGLTMITKFAIRRPRPFVYNGDATISSVQSINAQASFVSGHVSSTAASTFFIAKVYSDFYPDSKWKPVVWTAAILAPAVTGYLRVRAGKHYPTDVICGYGLGAAVGFLVPHLHHISRDQKLDLSLSPIPNGFYFSLNF